MPNYQIVAVLNNLTVINQMSNTFTFNVQSVSISLDPEVNINVSDSKHKIWPYTFFSSDVQDCFSPEAELIPNSPDMSYAINDSTGIIQVKLFEQ